MRKAFCVAMPLLLLLVLTLALSTPLIEAEPRTWTVDDDGSADFSSIQAAIAAASSGDTVYVHKGTYREHVIVDKALSVVGEDREATIINGSKTGIVVKIIVANVNLSGFTITDSGQTPRTDSGVFLSSASKSATISDNIIVSNYHGVFLEACSGHVVFSNNISLNTGRGLLLESSYDNVLSQNYVSENSQDNGIEMFDSTSNIIIGNTIVANGWAGIYLRESSGNTIILNDVSDNSVTGVWLETSPGNVAYRNNLASNGLNEQGQVYSVNSSNVWDNGVEGNYWSDYSGQDLNGDGVGDQNTPHLGVDSYPLMEPWRSLRTYPIDGSIVSVLSNSTIASFNFSQALGQIWFNATGANGGLGFSNVTIPKNLLDAQYPKIWTVTVDGAYVSFKSTDNSTHTSLFFKYAHSTRRVKIAVVEIPNIPPIAQFTYVPAELTPFDVLNFTDTSYDPDGSVVSWHWAFGDQTTSVEQNPRHKYDASGTYVVTLNVTDDRGTETSAFEAVNIRKVRTTLEANVPSSVEQYKLFRIVANLKDEKGNPIQDATIKAFMLTEKWASIDSAGTNSSGMAVLAYTPSLPIGTYLIRVSFNGTHVFAESSSVYSVEVLKASDVDPPTADAGADKTVYVGDLVTFNASGSRDNVAIASYDWGFGDGASGSGLIVDHVFSNAGKYLVTLTVRDAAGNADSDSLNVTVLSREIFPGWAVGLALGLALVVVAVVLVYVFYWRKRK